MGIVIIIVTVGLFYALLIVPQRRQVRAHKSLVDALKVGDEVITASGMFGVINDIDENVAILEVAPEVEIRVARGSISQMVPDELRETGSPGGGPDLDKPDGRNHAD